MQRNILKTENIYLQKFYILCYAILDITQDFIISRQPIVLSENFLFTTLKF